MVSKNKKWRHFVPFLSLISVSLFGSSLSLADSNEEGGNGSGIMAVVSGTADISEPVRIINARGVDAKRKRRRFNEIIRC